VDKSADKTPRQRNSKTVDKSADKTPRQKNPKNQPENPQPANRLRRWLDGFLLAGKGIRLALKEKQFWLGFLLAFSLFGTLMNLLSNGFSTFRLMSTVGLLESLKIIFDAFLGLFGFQKTFLDWLVIFIVAVLQGILIGLVVLVWQKKRKNKQKTNSENVQSASIAAGLAVLGTGCPTCGTALLTPVLGAIFAGSSALVGAISGAVTVLAVVIAILSIKKVGEEAYVIIKSEEYLKKKKSEEK